MLYSKASLSLFRLMVIRRSWVGWVIIVLQERRGCLREVAVCGHNKGVNLSAQTPWGMHIKESLSLFRLMAIQRSWVGRVIIVRQERHGCTREAGACGHNRGVSLSAQVALEVHGKAFLSPFRLMVIPQSWVGLMIMAMQGQHGCTREAPGGGHNRGVNLSAQALWGVHSKAALSLFRPMEIRRSWVG